ncbi:MAG: hypothetical protein MUF54_19385 [Polyangiaceae bacterium]|jgi:hypothetical protein|nr:hypothetical protein [Polyangiaceae bacterium]
MTAYCLYAIVYDPVACRCLPCPAELTHPDTVATNVTGAPLPDWAVGVDPAHHEVG